MPDHGARGKTGLTIRIKNSEKAILGVLRATTRVTLELGRTAATIWVVWEAFAPKITPLIHAASSIARQIVS
jgi:hypothetical protein